MDNLKSLVVEVANLEKLSVLGGENSKRSTCLLNKEVLLINSAILVSIKMQIVLEWQNKVSLLMEYPSK